MRSNFDECRDCYEVTITKSELEQAFKSEQDLHKFMHEIVANTYGEWMAEACFPLYRKDNTNDKTCSNDKTGSKEVTP